MNKKRVLILCNGNASRSQMAEALVNHELGTRVEAVSAGVHPHDSIDPHALAALREAGISTSGLYPKTLHAVLHEPFDLVVTVCDSAREGMPELPLPLTELHVPIALPRTASHASYVRMLEEIRARLLPELRRILGV